MINRITNWLETHYVAPAYAGWVLGGIALCFFGAATNTMAGWLYVISAISIALLGLAAVLPARSLRHLQVRRHSIAPVSVGDQLTVELEIENTLAKPQTLLQVEDVLPFVLGKPVQRPIETIPPQSIHQWAYYHPTQKRGVYRWHTVQLRSAAPLGLFWCRRHRDLPAVAIVYPTVLPLNRCPLIDEMGQEVSRRGDPSGRPSHAATEGITRSLRAYRQGDPTRLIHWRTSARYGELQVRELEVFTGGQEIIICLDSASHWNPDDFEQAVIAAASMYFYASGRQLNIKLWTALTGLLYGHRVVLEALAATYPQEDPLGGEPPSIPLVWLTQNPESLNSLPTGSRWVLWPPTSSAEATISPNRNFSGLVIKPEQPLQIQLQTPLSASLGQTAAEIS